MYDSALPSNPETALPDGVPASCRGDSEVKVRFEAGEPISSIADLYQRGSLRLRFPRGDRREAVLLNTGGGITGGDRLRVDVALEAGAEAILTSQAAEKIYRSDGPTARIELRVRLESAARLDWLPQETILFDKARVARRIDIEMAADAHLTMLEMLVFGRIAHGEQIRNASWQDRWNIRRGGSLCLAEAVRIDGDAVELLDRAAAGNGARAFATLVHVAPDAEQKLEDVRTAIAGADFPCAASAWNGMLVARFAARAPHELNAIAGAATCAVTGVALPRSWNC